jgi:hypothetical protein
VASIGHVTNQHGRVEGLGHCPYKSDKSIWTSEDSKFIPQKNYVYTVKIKSGKLRNI